MVEKNQAFETNDELLSKKVKPVIAPEKNIGIDTEDKLYQNIINAGTANVVDIGQINAFTNIARSRDQLYLLLDQMSDDSSVAAILEVYAEDATEYNDSGRIVWAESDVAEIGKFVNSMLDAINVDKNIYKWVYSLIKYGDVYLRLYRESEYDDLFFQKKDESKTLNEDVNIIAYRKSDRYIPYAEMVSNPAEMFELTRFGKTAGYIQADIGTMQKQTLNPQLNYYTYKFHQGDINLFQPTEFVHASLEDNFSRAPEEVDIFLDKENFDSKDAKKTSYQVKRGQSLLYSNFKSWRQLLLLENSVLLNRLTKSSIVRLVKVEVGDMDKQMVGPHLQGIKQLIEQKAAINVNESMSEYTNPGPVENNIYIPTHNGVGNIDIASVGGDVDVKGLADLEYYRDKFYSGMKVPKQYLNWTDDGAGFNGGQSLSIISSRYAKTIKRIQNTMSQMLTDLINLFCINYGLENYVNQFTIRFQPPTTQEEIDRRDNLSNKITLVRDIMDILNELEATPKLKILKALLADNITDPEVIQILQEEIEKLTAEENNDEKPESSDDSFDENELLDLSDEVLEQDAHEQEQAEDNLELDSIDDTGILNQGITPEEGEEVLNEKLPSPMELNAGDFSDSTNPNFDFIN